jgi:hypothetical protein
VTLIGYSGGGQIALGAAPFIKEVIEAPAHVIALGGVMSGNTGMLELDSLSYLYGSRDNVHRLGYIFFPQRWPLLRYTPWNQARTLGIIHYVPMGAVKHTGQGGYLDGEAKNNYLAHTVATIATLVRQQEFRENVETKP